MAVPRPSHARLERGQKIRFAALTEEKLFRFVLRTTTFDITFDLEWCRYRINGSHAEMFIFRINVTSIEGRNVVFF